MSRLVYLVSVVLFLFFVGCDLSPTDPTGKNITNPNQAKITGVVIDMSRLPLSSSLAKPAWNNDELLEFPEDAQVEFYFSDQVEASKIIPLGPLSDAENFQLDLDLTVSKTMYLSALIIDGFVVPACYGLILNDADTVWITGLVKGFSTEPSRVHYNGWFLKKGPDGKAMIVQKDDRNLLTLDLLFYDGNSYLTDDLSAVYGSQFTGSPAYPEMDGYWAQPAFPNRPMEVRHTLSFGKRAPLYFGQIDVQGNIIDVWYRPVIHVKNTTYYTLIECGYYPLERFMGVRLTGHGSTNFTDPNHNVEPRTIVQISGGEDTDFNALLYRVTEDGFQVFEENRPENLGWAGGN